MIRLGHRFFSGVIPIVLVVAIFLIGACAAVEQNFGGIGVSF